MRIEGVGIHKRGKKKGDGRMTRFVEVRNKEKKVGRERERWGGRENGAGPSPLRSCAPVHSPFVFPLGQLRIAAGFLRTWGAVLEVGTSESTERTPHSPSWCCLTAADDHHDVKTSPPLLPSSLWPPWLMHVSSLAYSSTMKTEVVLPKRRLPSNQPH
jgi:hypothetical protein